MVRHSPQCHLRRRIEARLRWPRFKISPQFEFGARVRRPKLHQHVAFQIGAGSVRRLERRCGSVLASPQVCEQQVLGSVHRHLLPGCGGMPARFGHDGTVGKQQLFHAKCRKCHHARLREFSQDSKRGERDRISSIGLAERCTGCVVACVYT